VRTRQIALAILLTFASVRSASADETRDEAAAHYSRALDLATHGHYEAALQEFSVAYTISPQFSVLYNIAQAEMALGHLGEAIETFSQYLSEGQEKIRDVRRQQVEALMALLESRRAELSIIADRPGASVTVDSKDVGTTPLDGPIRLDAGIHRVTARVDGITVLIRIVILRKSERQTVQMTLPSPTSKAAAAAAREAVSRAVAAADAAARAATEAEAASRAATAAAEREKWIASTRASSFAAARAATAQAQHEAAAAAARSEATPGGGGR
jgi:tetratricopeptide (TPR) repeat protein